MNSVSIVTPSYNQAQYIQETIESVQQQRYENLTHHVIDGGSNDGTIDILNEYDDIEWISEPDRGQSHAINKGFDRVNSDIVGWINSDDVYVFKRTIDDVVNAFKQTDADIVFGHALLIGPASELLRSHYIPRFNKKKLERICYIIQPSVFFRGYVVDENRLNEDREYSMDYEFWLDLAEQYDWYRLDRIISADRNHPDRKIIKHSEQSYNDTQALRNEREIDQDAMFFLKQTIDKISLRWYRVRMLPQLLRLYQIPRDEFAFNFVRPSLPSVLRTQLLQRKKQL
ncbi:glycosyltransferase family 2 protein [Halopenitus sp. H-Gu1]|uniref:glycosyltransferase family 2 protein n=1 Tax=Halopenitus sp. H-Gu1 TaxID=3242697 RepID=UPI00359F0B34